MKGRNARRLLALGTACFLLTGCAPEPQQSITNTEKEEYLTTIATLEAALQEEREAHYITQTQYQAQLEDLQQRLDKLSALPGTGEPDTEELIFRYRVENGGAVITGYSGSATLLTVPATLDGYPVMGIGERAFEGTKIAAIVLPEGLESIGWFAFYGCLELVNITIPASVSAIGYAVFDGCPDVTVVCPDGSYAERYARSYGLPYIKT